jgi:hypothetical protein
MVDRIEEERWEEMERAEERPARADGVTSPVALAGKLVKAASTKHKTIHLRVS